MGVDVELLARLSGDRALASAVLFSHRHPDESPAFHVEVMDLWRSADEFVLIEAFREGGKTTLSEEFLTLEGCFGNFPYALLVGETYTKACQRLDAIDKECRTNEGLQKVFGGAVLARKSTENRVWFASGALLEAVGWEQELQSFKYGSHRPWRAYLDDPENAERVRDAAAVDASMRKLHLELIPALDKNHRKLRLTQTRRAQDCMVTRLKDNPNWVYRSFPICDRDPEDPEAVAIWASRYPMEWIRNERRVYVGAGMLSEFLQAYMCRADNPEAKPFKVEMLQAMDVSPWSWMPRFGIFDPSRTSNVKRTRDRQKSDRVGKVVVSKMASKIIVHESSGRFQKPNELIDDLFATDEKHSLARLGVEKNSLDDWIMQPIQLEAMRRGRALPLKALQAPQDRSKEQFIMGLQPFAQARDIVLVGGLGAHPELVAEWANFPQGDRDVMNALAYALQMFSGVPMYEDFSGANIGDATTPDRGEKVFVCWNASATEVAAAALVRDGRRLTVAGDWSAAGAITDAVRTLAFDVRTTYPRATLESWVPADTFDQWQRIALVPALRAAKFAPMRGEHIAPSRGCLSERMRTVWHNHRLLMVDRKARLTLNALSAGYALPIEKGGRPAKEPEPGVSRLLSEAIECMVAVLDRQGELEGGFPKGANVAHTPGGVAYVTANPRPRA